ncbi:MAG: transcription-repair coupling factor [Phycisphaeraceae bacterium]|nr:MAG: transcription-repair coupling factor [Phycisphaeraceae bacterium]
MTALGGERAAADVPAPDPGPGVIMTSRLDLVARLSSSPVIHDLARAMSARVRTVASGASGSATHLIAGALCRLTGRSVVLVLAHLDEADQAVEELLASGVEARRFPALEALPGESAMALDLFAERLSVVRGLVRGEVGGEGSRAMVLACPIQALMQSAPPRESLDDLSRSVAAGDTCSPSDLVRWLEGSGYRRTEAVEEPGDFAVRGGIVDVFPPGGAAAPVRLDFFGDTVEKVTEIDLDTMGSDRAIPSAELVRADPGAFLAGAGVQALDLLPPGTLGVISELAEVVEQARGYHERLRDERGVYGPPAVLASLQRACHAVAEINRFSAGSASADRRFDLPCSNLPPFSKDTTEAFGELATLARAGRAVLGCENAGEAQRAGELIAQFIPDAASRIDVGLVYLHEGFGWDEGGGGGGSGVISLVPYHELLGRFTAGRRRTSVGAARAMDTFLDLTVGDYVVHADHGVARLAGLSMMKPRDLPGSSNPLRAKRELDAEEYLVLEFAGKSKLYVPATQIDLVQKYVGGFKGAPPLSTLGGQRWKGQKERVAESVRDLAGELLRVRAAREHLPGVAFPADTAWQKEFEAAFPYEETEDQLTALASIKTDMSRARPMDRLICGDVGFGKTELAIRAAFKAVEFGKQAAVLVPTTVLAEQHGRTFRARFAGYPFRVEAVTRFREPAEVRRVLADAAAGRVDVLIGTHRLLSEDVRFADLGLVVIDEEQRFGVEHKERLLRLRLTADILTLSATPIPRTLHMSLLGLRDISNLTTPPVDRRAIVTEVIPYNERRVKHAIERELAREGQVFYVHNRVHDIREVAERVASLAPGARVVFGHGQMEGEALEEVMLKFVRREADILVCTTIIESGIDIPTANTMIIRDADRFGLAELHQLRGRVGRSKHRAYCYLLMPEDRMPTEQARKRLAAIERYAMLGAGFKIAMRDLEIRGAGNILGPEQSGHIAAVGYEMYCALLAGAVRDLTHEPAPPAASGSSLEIGLGWTIPKGYIPSDARRLEAYRRIAVASSDEELAKVRENLAQAYGDPPRPVTRLLLAAQLRVALARLGVKTCTIRDKDVVFMAKDPAPLAAALSATPPGMSKAIESRVSVLPVKPPATLHEVYLRLPEKYLEPDTLLSVLRKRLCPAGGAG